MLARRARLLGRSLEPRSDVRPRGMTVLLASAGRQNSAYRSGCHNHLYLLRVTESDGEIVTPV